MHTLKHFIKGTLTLNLKARNKNIQIKSLFQKNKVSYTLFTAFFILQTQWNWNCTCWWMVWYYHQW